MLNIGLLSIGVVDAAIVLLELVPKDLCSPSSGNLALVPLSPVDFCLAFRVSSLI